MRRKNSTVLGVVVLSVCVLGSPATTSQAQSAASCPTCSSIYKGLIDADKASLGQLEDALAREKAWMDHLKDQGKVLTDQLLQQKENSEWADKTDLEWKKHLDEVRTQIKNAEKSARETQKMIGSLQKAIDGLKKAIQSLEAEDSACRIDQCKPTSPSSTKQVGMGLEEGVIWGGYNLSGFYVVDAECPGCEAAGQKLRDLKSQQDATNRAVRDAENKVQSLTKDWDELTAGLFKYRTSTRPSDLPKTPEQTKDLMLKAKYLESGLKQTAENLTKAKAKLEQSLAAQENLQMQIRNAENALHHCQEQRCAQPVKKPRTAFRMTPSFILGFTIQSASWKHPKTAVKETLDSIDAPPGSTKSSSTDTSTNTAAVELGLQIPLKATRRSVWGLEGGVTLANGTEFLGTATVEAMGSGGTALTAKVHYQFDTGKPVAVDLTGYVRGDHGFYFKAGPSYVNVPMKLTTTETFMVNGTLTNEMTSEDSIHDSALGFTAGLGWSWKHFEIGAAYRQAKINGADMKTAQAGVRVKFGRGF